MKYDDFQNKIDAITEKIGDDASNLILDDIAVLLNDNKQMNETIINKDNENEKLNKRIETLQNVNGNLLQQVDMKNTDDIKPKEEDKKPKIVSYKEVFDEYGNFKH